MKYSKSIFWTVFFLCGGSFWSKWMLNLPQRSCRWDCRIYMDLSYTRISLWISRWFPVESFVCSGCLDSFQFRHLRVRLAFCRRTFGCDHVVWCLETTSRWSMFLKNLLTRVLTKRTVCGFWFHSWSPFLGFCPVAYAGDVLGRWSETK